MKPNILIVVGLLAIKIAVTSCSNEPEVKVDTTIDKIQGETKPSEKLSVVKFKDRLFSISSPLESIVPLQGSTSTFEETLLLEIPKHSELTSKFNKAIYLGMLGADLGYSSVFNQQLKTVDQFKAVNDLVINLDLDNAIDESLLKRLADNSIHEDSLLILLSEFYRQSDEYLQENKRYDEASWILAGAWVEGMHLSLGLASQGNDKLRSAIAGQSSSFSNLLAVLQDSNNDPGVNELIVELKKLEPIYAEIADTYEYRRPEVDVDTRTTIIKGHTNYVFSDETLEKMRLSVAQLRTKLTSL